MGRITQNWTDNQKKFIAFVGRGKRTKPSKEHPQGEKRTMGQFAEAIGVSRETLYDWLCIPGFKMAIVEYSIAQHADDIPALVDGQLRVAKGQTEFQAKTKEGKKITLKPNTNAFNAIMKLMGATEKVETTGELEHSGNIGIQMTTMTDDELDKLIENSRA